MKKLLILCAALLLVGYGCAFLAGCAVNPLTGNPVGAPITANGVTLENGCVMDAINCVSELKACPGAHAEIFLCSYTMDGQKYGHAMTRYYWPPLPDPDAVAWVYDRANASTSMPHGLNTGDALALAQYMFSGHDNVTVTKAWWTTPVEITPPKK